MWGGGPCPAWRGAAAAADLDERVAGGGGTGTARVGGAMGSGVSKSRRACAPVLGAGPVSWGGLGGGGGDSITGLAWLCRL